MAEERAEKGESGSVGLPGELAIARFRLEFRAESEYEIRGYRGSAWRGVLGRALKRLVCVTRDGRCEECLIRQNCVYTYVFETPAEAVRVEGRRNENPPHPFVLGVEGNWRRRSTDREWVEITLVGRGQRASAYLVHALREGALRGLGTERVRLHLERVEQERGGRNKWVSALQVGGGLMVMAGATPEAPKPPVRVRVQLETPLRIRKQNDLVEQECLGFEGFVEAVLRRLALLSRYHSEVAWGMDHAGLRALAAKAVVVDQRLGWQDWARYSTRQDRKVPMGGVVGEMRVEMKGLEALWPLLWVGQWVNAGKGTSMGLGRYSLEEA